MQLVKKVSMFHVLLKLQQLLMLSWSSRFQYYWNVKFIFFQDRVSSSHSNAALCVVAVHLESTKLLLFSVWIVLVITQSSLAHFPYMKELWKRHILVTKYRSLEICLRSLLTFGSRANCWASIVVNICWGKECYYNDFIVVTVFVKTLN